MPALEAVVFGVLALVAVLEADTTGFTADLTVVGAVTFGRRLVAALAAETGAPADCEGVAAPALDAVTLATGVLTVAEGTITGRRGRAPRRPASRLWRPAC